jgi:CBS domain containing-hemolysin-like protein
MTDLHILVLLFSMVCIAFFAGIETGVLSTRRVRLRYHVRKRVRSARIIQEFLQNWDRLFGTVLVGTNLFTVIASVTAASLAGRLLGDWGEAVSTVVMAVVVLVFCEYVPKAWFRARPLERSLRFAEVLRFAEAVLRPLATIIVWVTKAVLPGDAGGFSRPSPHLSRDDFKVLTQEGETEQVFSAAESRRIQNVMDVGVLQIRDIMVPRERIVFVDSRATVGDFLGMVREKGHAHLPMYDEQKRVFVGVVNVFRVLAAENPDPARPVAEFAKPPLFVSENISVAHVLPRLRHARQILCLVKDRNGEVTGAVTPMDVARKIVAGL